MYSDREENERPLESRRHGREIEPKDLSEERAEWPQYSSTVPPLTSPMEPPTDSPTEMILDRAPARTGLLPLPTFPRNSAPYLFDDGTGAGPSMVDFEGQVERHAKRLKHLEIERLIWVSDNCSEWPILELAAYRARVVLIPIDSSATWEHLDHLINVTGSDAILTADPDRIEAQLGGGEPLPPTWNCRGWRIPPRGRVPAIPAETARITFTRGVTGPPRGVCHSLDQIWAGARVLHQALKTSRYDAHLALMSLADLGVAQWTMLDPLISGGNSILPPLAPLGLAPGMVPDSQAIHTLISECEPTTLIMTPQILEAWLGVLPPYRPVKFSRLRTVVVVGAPISRPVRRHAKEIGLPIHEGYGLRECGALIAMNTAREQLDGSVGRPLDAYTVRIASDGELWVKGPSSLGTLGLEGFAPAGVECPTGDIAFIDAAGFLSLQGRKKSRIITKAGRKLCPEWIEDALRSQSAIEDAFVFGHDKPRLSAALVPRAGHEAEVGRAFERVNQGLPESARIGSWYLLAEPLSYEARTLTAAGHPNRDEIYARAHQHLYEDPRPESGRTP